MQKKNVVQQTDSLVNKILHKIQEDTDEEVEGDYVIFANKITQIKMIKSEECLSPFNLGFAPEYLNQVFRESENIHGFKNLSIIFNILAGSLYAYVELNYDEKLENHDQLEEYLNQFFLGGYTLDRKDFFAHLKQESLFKPLGKLKNSYIIGSRHFEIYLSDFNTNGFFEYNQKMQIFTKLFIDGASYVEKSDYWKYFCCFEKLSTNGYQLIGFISTYSFMQSVERSRLRISQVVILPNHQRQGHGQKILESVYDWCWSNECVFEITVEDSSVDFQVLRDYKDTQIIIERGYMTQIQHIRNQNDYDCFKLSKNMIEKIQKELKFTINQINRVFEIIKLSLIDFENNELVIKFQTDVKKRLFIANKKEFQPFANKKIPFISFDDNVQKINSKIYQNMSKEEILSILDDTYQKLIKENYEKILPKVKQLIFQNQK